MDQLKRLRDGRNILLKLHKSLVDFERATYETLNGTVTSGQFLNLLLNDADFSWLRRFSTLIVDIDEMFDQKDGFPDEAVETHLTKMRELSEMAGEDDYFRAKYQLALQNDPDAAGHHAELKRILT
jgi:hypothetical protein